MGNNQSEKSRRKFLSLFFPPAAEKSGKVKMLTADGKLVEIDKDVLEKASKKQKASNEEILHWMKNPSKKDA